ncbi:hypothetical protein [Streptomyces rimosus]|uniref:hypothetical protein n=1 Tax=Streptomyces rimosus TaxID=1927 RepID=UPI0037D7EE29
MSIETAISACGCRPHRTRRYRLARPGTRLTTERAADEAAATGPYPRAYQT